MKKQTNLDWKNKFIKDIFKNNGNLSISEYFEFFAPILFLRIINLSFEENKKKLEPIYQNDPASYNKNLNLYLPFDARWNNLLSITNPLLIKDKLCKAFNSLIDASEANNVWLKGLQFNDVFDNKKYKGIQAIQLLNFLDKELNLNEEISIDEMINLFDLILKEYISKIDKKSTNKLSDSLFSLLINLLKPTEGKIYDPCFGFGETYIQVFKYFVENDDSESFKQLFFYGQEQKLINWKLTKMRLLLNGIDNSNLGNNAACTFKNDQYLEKTNFFDFIFAIPPQNLADYWVSKLENDSRWKSFGLPPKGNANYAWIEHIISKLNNKGKAAIVLTNGSLINKTSLSIRKKLIENNLIDCIINLPSNLLKSNSNNLCLWILNKKKSFSKTLFINATYDHFGFLIKSQRILKSKDIRTLSNIYQSFLIDYENVNHEWAKVIDNQEILDNNCSLVSGEYVDFIDYENNDKNFKKELTLALDELENLQKEKKEYENMIFKSLNLFQKEE